MERPSVARKPSRWWYLVFSLIVGGVVLHFLSGPSRIPYSEFVRLAEANQLTGVVVIGEQSVRGTLTREDGSKHDFETLRPPKADVVPLLQGKVDYTGAGNEGLSIYLLLLAIPVLLVIFLLLFVLRSRGGTPVSALPFGRHKAKVVAERDTMVSFGDVAGIDEAVEEVREIVEYLRAPERFQSLGGQIPKGVLLVGMPGTGKTLLARAVAGEAASPFLSISGADFVEMFVGVGASRVRDLFAKAKEMSPCIIFIDELDALGKARGPGGSGGSEEREQTLNQLLVEMDGFSPNAGVIVLAATNRPEVLDQALLRAGRFDRQVVVDRPDVRGRLEILRLHTRNIRLGRNVDLAIIARRTPGFTGADLATVVNEAALLAARRNRPQVGMAHIEESIDRVVAGLERKSRLISPREKGVVAVHECGHAMVACLVPHADPLHRVSVIPRGVGIGGMTLQIPREDRGLVTRSELYDRIAVLLGGRVAEDLVFNDLSSGGANDLRSATEIARRMVAEYGMSERLGPVSMGGTPSVQSLRRGAPAEQKLSEETAREVDLEIRRIISEQEERVRALLEDQKRRLVAIARVLRDRETLDARTFHDLLSAPFKKTTADTRKRRTEEIEEGA